MLLADGRTHLTYCLNVHPGESWAENLRSIRDNACAVKQAVSPDHCFGLGLRLGAQAAAELETGNHLGQLRDFMDESGLYTFTVNAFPYGNFHSSPVKEAVYRPDWSEPSRGAYTLAVARILAELLPDGTDGSISTVPVGYRGGGPERADIAAAGENLLAVADGLARLEAATGKRIVLALEPEPDCLLGTIAEFVSFYRGPLAECAHRLGRERVMRRHLGICLDLAHAAVEFEDLIPAMDRLWAAGVPIAKIQVSAALVADGTPESLAALPPFCEPVYLHQTRIRNSRGEITRFPDLRQALEERPAADGDEWRIHYHVPLFWPGGAALRSSSEQIPDAVRYALDNSLTSHLEIETYTFTVLPPQLAPASLNDGIVREFEWLLAALAPRPFRKGFTYSADTGAPGGAP